MKLTRRAFFTGLAALPFARHFLPAIDTTAASETLSPLYGVARAMPAFPPNVLPGIILIDKDIEDAAFLNMFEKASHEVAAQGSFTWYEDEWIYDPMDGGT